MTTVNGGTSSGMLGEDVVNTVTSLLSRLELRMMEAIAHSADTRRAQFADLQAHTDARHDAVTLELDRMLALVEVSATELKKFGDIQGGMATALSALLERVDMLDAANMRKAQQIQDLRDEIGALRITFAAHDQSVVAAWLRTHAATIAAALGLPPPEVG